ncbi:hypothetical protein ACHAQJ_009932 [Trichoderma viride]
MHTKRAPPDPIAAQLDFRTFIELLCHDDDLADIQREVDPYLEVGAIVRRVSERNDKAPLFSNVKGAKNGLWRIFGNAASLRHDYEQRYGRIARNLGLPPTASWMDICKRTQAGKTAAPMPPIVLDTGPCKENKILGEEIDLNALPVPLLRPGDGGKYLQTYGIHILTTPNRSWTNWSIFRGMVYSKNQLVCLVGRGQHNQIIRAKWEEQGKSEMPWALALGVPPAASLVAALPVPEGVSEGEYVGAMVGKPLEVVKCELSDLLVPANSEIILEGTTSLTDKALEGPFEDFLGIAFENDQHLNPLFTVKAITYRNNAILPVSVPGKLTDESHTTASMASEELLTLLHQHNLPIKGAYAPFETYATWCVLQVDTERLRELKTNSADFSKKIGDIAFYNKSCMLINRIVLIGDDVDIYDFNSVIWAFITRCRPGKDEYLFEDCPSFPMTPYMSHGRRDVRRGGKVVSDCLFPMEYDTGRLFSASSFEASYPEDIKKRVRDTWRDMGFVTPP